MSNKKSAYETWKDAGRKFAKDEKLKGKSIVELGEESFRYAAAQGWCPHQDIIRRAFREGFFEAGTT